MTSPPVPPTATPAELAQVAEAVAPAGRFRIYLGVAAGVGKTCAMLDEGQRRRQRGTDVVVGIVHTHGRPHTAERLAGLEVVPPKRVAYRGATFEEMDLEAVLARAPKVALVDELAHTNVPGAGPHEKRYEDVLTLLDAGISVVTTLNVQHIESLADEVERITGVAVRERVPDWVVRRADQVELVDSSPEQLRRRMLHGNVYPLERVPDALAGFFRTENLVALREMALRFVADETDQRLLAEAPPHGAPLDTAERILVAVTGAPGTDMVLRRAARLAHRAKAELHVVHVRQRDADLHPGGGDLGDLTRLAEDLGGRVVTLEADDPAAALVEYARAHEITQIVLGSSGRSRWQELTRGSVVQRVLRYAAAAGVDVHVIGRRDRLPPQPGLGGPEASPSAPHRA
ncbi:universal stress protein [Aciditerrimonas ferrireducens]|jgi:two-component system sensor histidine kinase KdpD|uniref:universal stress protein n=1 Tax=Aciditerrimonas ferrireducens TaxID=667306 RepID=UPI002003A5E6|nr:universal stress protein [Aciditerrimonas ferrireducens]MCK4176722.1 universal stress protein [Aciditerrimonas ferrireducens]